MSIYYEASGFLCPYNNKKLRFVGGALTKKQII